MTGVFRARRGRYETQAQRGDTEKPCDSRAEVRGCVTSHGTPRMARRSREMGMGWFLPRRLQKEPTQRHLDGALLASGTGRQPFSVVCGYLLQ